LQRSEREKTDDKVSDKSPLIFRPFFCSAPCGKIRGVSSCQSEKFNAAPAVRAAAERFSLARCREILRSNCPASDADLERLRDQLYAFAHVTVEAFTRQSCENSPLRALNHAGSVFKGETGESPQPAFSNVLTTLPPDERYVLEERAAIHEFDGGLDRSAAECAAFSEYWRENHRKI
jgi:hypothetical protein